MSEPQSNAPGTVKRTDDDHTDDAIARMLNASDKAMAVIQVMASFAGAYDARMRPSCWCPFCNAIDDDELRHSVNCPVTLARELLGRN